MMMRLFYILLFALFAAGCSQPTPHDAQVPNRKSDEVSIPTAATEAAALLLRSTAPSPEVDEALALISEYEDKSMRLVETIKEADGSLHVELEHRYPQLGMLVYHYDQKFTHASTIPDTR
jgi:PBP1b-binding outer membrane lipoprotein LpoB